MAAAILVIAAVACGSPVLAQDDCPSNHVRNPAISPLDHDYMLRAFTASFRGLFGRDPSMQPGSGKDDGEYYIAAANHFGVYGDDQCHAGWSGYWESWLEVGHGDLGRVQSPARFLPTVAPPPEVVPPPVVRPPVVFPSPPPVVVPPPVYVPPLDLSGVYAQLGALQADVAAARAESQQFYRDARTAWGDVIVFVGKYIAPALAALEIGLRLGK